ncbi:hypothetical protein Tco_1072080, partial [Tanacetum coccineum]
MGTMATEITGNGVVVVNPKPSKGLTSKAVDWVEKVLVKLMYDSSQPHHWLFGNFAPVDETPPCTDLDVIGHLPNLNGDAAEAFRSRVSEGVSAQIEAISASDANSMWNFLASIIRDAAKDSLGEALGSSKTHTARRESWWLCEEVQSKVAEKQARFRELLSCQEGNLEERLRAQERYKLAKREAKKAVAQAKEKAYEDLYKKLDSKEGANEIFRIAKARQRRRRDLGDICFIKDEGGRT